MQNCLSTLVFSKGTEYYPTFPCIPYTTIVVWTCQNCLPSKTINTKSTSSYIKPWKQHYFPKTLNPKWHLPFKTQTWKQQHLPSKTHIPLTTLSSFQNPKPKMTIIILPKPTNLKWHPTPSKNWTMMMDVVLTILHCCWSFYLMKDCYWTLLFGKD